jgi:CRP/FNR family cyclic AMP-dependent transcriptional regulator
LRSELEIPLFAGLPDEELRQMLRPADLQAGDVLFRQGEEADGLYVVAAGSIGVYTRLPGGREVEIAVLGAGEVVGELALVDGGTRAATVRAVEPTAVLFFGRADFLALASRLDPMAFALKRRLAAIVCERLRGRLELLSGSLDEHDAAPEVPTDELVSAPLPDERYLVRLPFFRAFAPSQLPRLLAACRTLEVPAYRALLHEGARSDSAYVTLNGAVEEVLGWGRRRIRVRLAGPGHAVGYVGLLDDGPSPVTVATRERALLLAVPAATFAELFDGATALSYAFVEAVQRDLIAAVRQAERPQARLAAAQQAMRGGRSSGTSASVTSRNERANSTKR